MNIKNSDRISVAKRIINGASVISVPLVILGLFLFMWKVYPEFWNNFVDTEGFAISVIVAIVVSLFSIKMKILNRAEKAKAAAIIKEQDKKNQEKADREEKLDRMIQEIIEKQESRNWKLILSLTRSYSSQPSKFSKILPFIHYAPLSEVVTISKYKQQIVWAGDFEDALKMINEFAVVTFKDDELELLKKQLNDFIAVLDEVKYYGGYAAVMNKIKKLCPVILNMVETSKELVS